MSYETLIRELEEAAERGSDEVVHGDLMRRAADAIRTLAKPWPADVGCPNGCSATVYMSVPMADRRIRMRCVKCDERWLV